MIGRVIGAILFVILFNAAALGLMLFLPPWIGLLWALALGGAFLWWHLRKDARSAERQALVRIGRPSAPFGWLALACLSTLALLFGIVGLLETFGTPLKAEELKGWDLLIAYQESLPGWIALTTLIALVIPVVEEFNFRGRVQHLLENKYGIVIAVSITSVLFAITHFSGSRLGLMFVPLALGVANGLSVFLFQSVWVPVATHSLWNGSMAVLGALRSDAAGSLAGTEDSAGLSLSIVFVALGVIGWLAILRSTHPALRRGPAIQPDEAAP